MPVFGSDSTNTPGRLPAMQPDELEMIREINRLRSNPKSYLVHVEPLLAEARKTLKEDGKGARHYSLTYNYRQEGDSTITRIDTNWHYSNVERVKALESLVNDLKKLRPLSVLLPDTGIYRATVLFARDQQLHQWTLMHTGSDGSAPWDRITRHSPKMSFGNENLAGNMPCSTPRGTVIQLLVDAGIPGYGHRYNLLDPQWTHVACRKTVFRDNYCWWIQNFGRVGK